MASPSNDSSSRGVSDPAKLPHTHTSKATNMSATDYSFQDVEPLSNTAEEARPAEQNLHTLPGEIVDNILELLLTNPMLGTPASVSKEPWYNNNIKYSLSPKVLRVCSRLYDRGIRALYRRNTFYALCIPDAWGYYCGPQLCSPITRYWPKLDPGELPSGPRMKVLRLVMRWLLVVHPINVTGYLPRISSPLMQFCHIVHLTKHDAVKLG